MSEIKCLESLRIQMQDKYSLCNCVISPFRGLPLVAAVFESLLGTGVITEALVQESEHRLDTHMCGSLKSVGLHISEVNHIHHSLQVEILCVLCQM